MIADRRAAKRHDDVGRMRERGLGAFRDLRAVVGRDSQIEDRRAFGLRHGRDAVAVRRHDLVRLRRVAGRDELVPGRQDRHHRPADDGKGGVVGCSGEGEGGGVEHPAGVEQHVAFGEVEPGAPDVPSGLDGFDGGNRVVFGPLGILLDQDGIGAGGKRRAGEDPDGFSGTDCACETAAGRGFADHLKPRRHRRDVGGAHGIAVHGGRVEGRLRAQSGDRLCQDPEGGIVDRHGLGGKRSGIGQEPLKRVVDRHQRHQTIRPRCSRRTYRRSWRRA